MSRRTTTQQQQQTTHHANTNTYGYMPGPGSADIDTLRNFQFTVDPSIGYVYGNARNQAANSFNNPLGGVYSPQMRDSILRSTLSDLTQREGQARSEAYQQTQGARFGQVATVAGLTAPRLVQTGSSGSSSGTSQGSTTQPSNFLENLMVGVATGAAGAAA